MYFVSVLDNVISDWSFDDQAIQQLAYFMMKPNLLKAERKYPESFRFQLLAKLASIQSSKPLFLFRLKIRPLSLVLFKYHPILLIALPCIALGSLQRTC